MLHTVQTFYACTSRTDICQCLVVQKNMDNISKNEHINDPCILRSKVPVKLHPCQGNWAAIVRAIGYYARAAHAFSAGIKCRYCMYQSQLFAKLTILSEPDDYS